MAEIKIEKKKPVWPWIVAILLIAAVAYYVFAKDDETRNDRSVETENAVSTDTTTLATDTIAE
ncbi:hypothetical protein [Flavobacterium chungbukense]|uniref:Uncharacterized protein n=1 Tax=Flavobacterium chungbukense TaxID=877464 RepID=A0ABP7XME2_9FLAO|nr:hypothetical protein [Flavobacterium chungbukense]MCC4920722.1 hypothetical protein [Flavobacterium chungbukense]